MSFGNPSELSLLARICFARLMLFSVGTCLVFVANTEHKNGLLPSIAMHINVKTCDACDTDHMVRFTMPSPSVFAYCKRSKTGAGEGLGMRLAIACVNPKPAYLSVYTCLFACGLKMCQAFLEFDFLCHNVHSSYLTAVPIVDSWMCCVGMGTIAAFQL